jgi:hypothetical protein
MVDRRALEESDWGNDKVWGGGAQGEKVGRCQSQLCGGEEVENRLGLVRMKK